MKNYIRQIFLLLMAMALAYPPTPTYAQKLKQQTTKSNNNPNKNTKSSKSTKKNSTTSQPKSKRQISTIITSYPSEATVYVNGVFTGYTPCVHYTESQGYINIECTKSGFSTQTRNVYINGDQQVNFELDYEYRAISITSNPSNASIWINGKFVGTTPYTYNAQKGEYINITCTYVGYQNAYRTITSDMNQNVNFSLVPEKSPQTSYSYNNSSYNSSYTNLNRHYAKDYTSYPKKNFYIDAGIGSYFNNESWYSIASSIGFNINNFNMQWDLNYALDNTSIFTDIMLGFSKRVGRSKVALQGGLGCYVYSDDNYDDSYDSIGFALGFRYDLRLCKHLTFFANPVVIIGKSYPVKLSTGISFYL